MKLNKELLITILVSAITSFIVGLTFICIYFYWIDDNWRQERYTNYDANIAQRDQNAKNNHIDSTQRPHPEVFRKNTHRGIYESIQQGSDSHTRSHLNKNQRRRYHGYYPLWLHVNRTWPHRAFIPPWHDFDLHPKGVYEKHYQQYIMNESGHVSGYHRAIFQPANPQPLRIGDKNIIAQKSICSDLNGQQVGEVRYNIYNSDHHGVVWKEVSLTTKSTNQSFAPQKNQQQNDQKAKNSDVNFGIAWFTDVYTPIDDLWLIDQDLYIKIKQKNEIWIIDTNTGIVKSQVSDKDYVLQNKSTNTVCDISKNIS